MSSLDEAILLHKKNNLDKAEIVYLSLLRSNSDPNINYLLGFLYSQKSQYVDAIKHLEYSVAKNTTNADLFGALAFCYQKLKKYNVAKKLIDIAIRLAPQNPNFCNRKSKILFDADKQAQCRENALYCIDNHPDFFPAYQTLSSSWLKENRPDNSLRTFKLAYKLLPQNADVIFCLAEAYQNVGNAEKAKKIFQLLVNNHYRLVESYNNLGNIERDYGDLSLSRKYFIKALNIAPHNHVVKWNLSLLNLLEENFEDGWPMYENRLFLRKKQMAFSNIKNWRGENLNGKRVIILAEQGVGDAILFASSFPAIVNQAEKTIIQCDSRLAECFTRSFCKAQIISSLSEANTERLDYKIHMGSIFQFTHLERSYQPYLQPSKQPYFYRADHSSLNNESKLINIGFSWRGGITYKDLKKRSTHLRQWKSIFDNNSVHFHCLQNNITNDEQKFLSNFPNITLYTDVSKNGNIDMLINLISNMDLVISVTNTNVHIAGALGVKSWCLTPHNPDWPWGLNNDTCRWYPSVQLMRKSGMNWNTIFSKIEKQLGYLNLQLHA